MPEQTLKQKLIKAIQKTEITPAEMADLRENVMMALVSGAVIGYSLAYSEVCKEIESWGVDIKGIDLHGD